MAGELPIEQPQGLLLSGEGISFLTLEHRRLLAQVAGALAGGRMVELTVVDEAATGNSIPTQESESASLDLSRFTSVEIIGIRHDIDAAALADFDSADKLSDAFLTGFCNLISQNSDLATETIQIWSHSEQELDRRVAALFIDRLVATSAENAMVIWRRLLQDPNEHIRDEARETIDAGVDRGSISLEQALRLIHVHFHGTNHQ